MVSIGDLLLLIDKTILNPWLGTISLAAIHFFTTNKFVVLPKDGFIPYTISRSLPPILQKAVVVVGLGFLLRLNRALSRRALNNGVSDKYDWGEEIIVVTGGSGGIGAATVQKLAARGSTVIVIDVLDLTFTKPANVHFYKCDLSNYEAVQAVQGKISKEIGDPTCVVACAGICRGKPILEASKRDIELTFGVNNLGVLWTAKAFLPNMVKHNHGHFLIIASQTAYLATAGITDYAATRAAAVAIYEGLQTEVKHVYKAPAVRLSCLCPSAVNTKMFTGIKGPSNFFMPFLKPADLGDCIANILWSGQAQNLSIPAFAYISPPTRALPDWMRVGMQDGGADVMTELKPHKPLN